MVFCLYSGFDYHGLWGSEVHLGHDMSVVDEVMVSEGRLGHDMVAADAATVTYDCRSHIHDRLYHHRNHNIRGDPCHCRCRYHSCVAQAGDLDSAHLCRECEIPLVSVSMLYLFARNDHQY